MFYWHGYANELSVLISVIIFCIIAYLLGSINFAIIFTKKFLGTDIREHGSGNAGMTNVMRTAGKLPGILTFVCDFLKGTVAVLLAKFLYVPLANLLFDNGVQTLTLRSYAIIDADVCLNPELVGPIVAIFCLLGHMFPIFFKFKGGKGVATIVGTAAAFSPFTALCSFAVFVLVLLMTEYVSLSSIIAVTVAVPFTYLFFKDGGTFLWFSDYQVWVAVACTFIMSSMVIIKHKENIVRLKNGTERKTSDKKRKKG